MTLLTICQEVADEIGVVSPGFVVSNPDPTAKRLLASAKAEGQALYRAHNWSIQHREYTFETTAGEANYAVPEDWGRPLGMTAWDRTTFWQMRGNKSPAQWQRLQSSLAVSTSFRRSFRLLVGPLAASILIDPTPSATGEDLVIEYVSSYWCEDANGNGQTTFAADTDEMRLDHEVFRLGLLWRMQRVLGNTYAAERADYELALRDAKVADVNMPIVNTAGPPRYDPGQIVPEGNWTL